MDVTSSELAAWVQAVGSVAAIVWAICLWRFDRKRIKDDQRQQEKSSIARLIAGLREEIQVAIEAVEMQQTVATGVVKRMQNAHVVGNVTNNGPVALESLRFSDGIIFRAMANEVGRLPAQLITEVVSFYAFLATAERSASISPTASGAMELIADLAPRLRMKGSVARKLLDNFAAADFDPSINIKPSREEFLALAKEVGYPIEAVAAERGIKI